jgi:tetratricopeptide (TPR) repeat protein
VVDGADPDHDILQELLDANRAVRLDETHYELYKFVQPLHPEDDHRGYAAMLMWYAIKAARADRTLNPDGQRLGIVYEYVTKPYATAGTAVAWFHDNGQLLGLLVGAMRRGVDNAACELAEPLWALACHVGDHSTANTTQMVTIALLNGVTDRPEHRRATAQARLAFSLSSIGLHDQALADADRAVELAAQLADRSVLSMAHSVRGRANQLSGNLPTALTEYALSLHTVQQANTSGIPPRHLRSVPAALTIAPSPDAEQLMIRIADAISLNTASRSDPAAIALQHLRLASVNAATGDLAIAIAHLEVAEGSMAESGDATGRALIQTCLARALLDDGQTTAAYAASVSSIGVLETSAHDRHVAEAAAVAGHAAEHAAPTLASGYYILAIAKFRESGQRTRADAVQRRLDEFNLAPGR